MRAEAGIQDRISSGYAALVALYQLLQARGLEPGAAPSVDWAARLAVLRVLREADLPGDRAALAGALLDPAARSVADVAVSTRPERLGELVAEAVRLGERVLFFGAPEALPEDLLAVGPDGRPVGVAWARELEALGEGFAVLDRLHADADALGRARADRETDERAAAEGRIGLTAAIDAALGEKAQARAAADHATRALDGAVAEEGEAAAESAARLESFTAAKAVADEAADTAARAAQAAQAAQQRAVSLEQRLAAARAQVAGAEQAEVDLGRRLDQAREQLPAATAEAERTSAAATEAEALAHATYYRLAGAESALAAVRKRQSLGQRLHLAPAGSELADKRAAVSSHRLENEQAQARAVELHAARQRAEGERAGIAAFLEGGDREIGAAREARRRASEEIPRLEEGLLPARAEHEALAATAAETAGRARAAAEPADEARRHGIAAEERLAAARAALAAAEKNAGETAQAVAVTTQTLVDAEAALADLEKTITADASRLRRAEETAREAVQASSEAAAAVLGDTPEDAWRATAEARRALLSDRPGEAARVTCADPDHVPPGTWDVLFVADAASFTDGDFLLGAVRTRRQVLSASLTAADPAPDPALRPFLAALAVLFGLRQDPDPETAAEAARLTASGLWETLYAEPYAKIVRRLTVLGLDPAEALEAALTDRLETSVFARCLSVAAP
ncbi:hypothetical protein EDD29_5891 [Actinocorallia herbida]|uniref:Uncharacterized protein n=1 Tax=Actinocorallia herbida TaxID=58109 RepID=A0A3N1D571_9ACTN|nr:hypothetical protein [Actinocorallia herbida]ROO88228.1 hypothetical protein EDD29_5891 [Actinocorallia herbida]